MRQRAGFTMAEMLVGIALTGLVAWTAARVVGLSVGAEDGVHRQAAFTDIGRSLLSAQQVDPRAWLDLLRERSPYLAECLPPSGSSAFNDGDFKCGQAPEPAALDARVLAQAGGDASRVTTLELFDAAGAKIAGAASQPVYLTRDGAPCDPKQNPCALQSVGYLVRENATGSPGDVQFIVATNPVPGASSSTRLPQSDYRSVIVPESTWAYADNELSPLECAPGTLLVGVNQDGSAMCRIPFVGGCKATKNCYLYGFSNGQPLCRAVASGTGALPEPRDVGTMSVSGGKDQKHCNNYTPPNLNGGTIAKITVVSKGGGSKGCDVGDEIVNKGTYICARDKCKGTIRVWVQDPAPPAPASDCAAN